MPLGARRSEHRVSANSTTWLCQSATRAGIEPGTNWHECLWSPRLRAWNPASKRTGHIQCAGQESNLQSSKAGGLQPLRLANAQPTRLVVARVGVEPTIREGRAPPR
jgi:hypothetical protein